MQKETAKTTAAISKPSGGWSDLYLKEDWWAIWMGLGIVLIALLFWLAGGSIKGIAVSPPTWTNFGVAVQHLQQNAGTYVMLYLVFVVIFSVSSRIMRFKLKEFIPGFTILYVLSIIILVAGSWETAKNLNLEPPLLALFLGLIVSNTTKLPKWLEATFRTEYYIKTGIVLLGATLPFTLIIQAGPIALIQATIVAVSTFVTIYLAATKIFKFEPQFGATMAAGGSICGVSAAIAMGGAVKAKKEHTSIAIALVTIWAIIMIIVLPLLSKALNLPPGVAGAWIGTSEFADAAGFAAAQAIGHEAAVQTFTLMKVIGRDIWIGVWAFIMSIISVTVWEKGEGRQRASAMEIWWRFPKFVIGFFAASLIMSLVSAGMSTETFNSVLNPEVIAPVKTLRTWTFVFTFLSIGFTTRFRELTSFGWKPLGAFSLGVLVNVPLGFILSVLVFGAYWAAVGM